MIYSYGKEPIPKYINFRNRSVKYLQIIEENYSIDVRGATWEDIKEICNDLDSLIGCDNVRLSQKPRKNSVETLDYKTYNKPYKF